MDDWLAATDDTLCERFPGGCSSCGRGRPVHLGLHLVNGLAVATAVCRTCQTADPDQRQLGAVLAARYNPTRWDGHRPP